MLGDRGDLLGGGLGRSIEGGKVPPALLCNWMGSAKCLCERRHPTSSRRANECPFRGNSANYGGGLITFPDITATLTNVIFRGNAANYGGGILTTGSNNLTLTNVTISGNAALVLGGGLYSENGSNPQVRNSIAWGDGSNGVYIGNDQNKSASVPVFSASSTPTCAPNQVVSFALDANPLTGAAGAYSLGAATTDSSGQATAPAISTTGWLEGVYTINTSFAGTTGCLPSSDSATLTAASSRAAANGSGWYTLSGSWRVNFGFTVRKVDT